MWCRVVCADGAGRIADKLIAEAAEGGVGVGAKKGGVDVKRGGACPRG